MRSPTLLSLLGCAFIAVTGFQPAALGEEAEAKVNAAVASDLVVHEWGVLWVGKNSGEPFVGATDRYLNALPEWVCRNEKVSPNVFTDRPELLIIDKPVIHFYGAEGQPVEVTVKVSKGFPIVYFPEPELERKSLETVNGKGSYGTLEYAQSMKWKFRLTKKSPDGLAAAPPDHWWNAARKIPSDYVVMENGKGSERFLFYEGTTFEKPTVSASVGADSVTLRNADSEASRPVILIVNDNGSYTGAYLESVEPVGKVEIAADKFKPWSEETLMAQCRKQWEACGMTAEEAGGIVESWRPELLDTPGFLLISAIPNRIYEGIFPIDIKPVPAELKRACFVFDTLAGQDLRKHWLPELRKVSGALLRKLSAVDFKERLEAHSEIVDLGESLSPFVQELLEKGVADPQSIMAATVLRNVLSESPVCAHRQPVEAHNPYSGFVPLRRGDRLIEIPPVPVPVIPAVPPK